MPADADHARDVEADVIGTAELVLAAPETFAGAFEACALPAVDAAERRRPRLAAARANFDQDQRAAVLDEQVDLEIVHAQIGGEHAQAACFEPITNCFFCGEA